MDKQTQKARKEVVKRLDKQQKSLSIHKVKSLDESIGVAKAKVSRSQELLRLIREQDRDARSNRARGEHMSRVG